MSEMNVPPGMAELAKAIDEADGVLTTTMAVVRTAYGAERLGSNVRSGIREMLQRMGIGFSPTILSNNQHDVVRLYRLGSPVGKLIRAALRPSESNDEILRDAAASDKAMIIQKVKELVCS